MWNLLTTAQERICSLEKEVERATLPASASGRELCTFVAQEVLFAQPYSFEEKRGIFYNGDMDTLTLCRVGVEVYVKIPDLQGGVSRYQTTKEATGFNMAGFTSINFDFQWNYLINSTQSLYSRDYLGSDILAAGQDRAQMFSFHTPLILAQGDSIEFRIRPTNFTPPPYFFTADYVVSFILLGYRGAR